jgi:signal transduction histidine kinase/ligand-binding sensor domain-containing protein
MAGYPASRYNRLTPLQILLLENDTLLSKNRSRHNAEALRLAKWSFLCLMVLLAGSCRAKAQYRSTQWTTDNGLPQNSVRGIVQGTDGYIWVATLNGVARFDGIRFTVFDKSNTPGITSNRFVSMVRGGSNELWLPSEDGNLIHYHEGRFETIEESAGLRPHSVGAITGDQKGGVWIESDDKIFAWNAATRRFKRMASTTDDLHFIPLWWVGTGFWAMHGNQLICFARGSMQTHTLPASLPISKLRGVALGGDGVIWIGLKDGSFGQLTNGVLVMLPEITVMPYRDHKLSDWKVEVTRNFTRKLIFPSSGVEKGVLYNVTMKDTEGNAWIGSEDEGLFRVQKQSITTLSTTQGLASDNVYPILKMRSGDIWIGSWPAGLSRVHDGHVTAYTKQDGVPGLISSLYEDRAGTLWVATHNGIRTLVHNKLVTPPGLPQQDMPAVQAMYQTAAGDMLLGSSKGIYVVAGSNSHWMTIKDGLATYDTRAMIEDRRGDIWIAGYGGVTRIHNGITQRWTEAQGLPSNNVRSVFEDSAGEIWVGTYDGGIGWFRNGQWVRFDVTRGLYDNGAFQILEDDKHQFWMSSNRGIYRVSRQQLQDVADGKRARVDSVAYGRADGMLSVECNGGLWPAGVKDDKGNLWFPTQKGVAIVDPSSVMSVTLPPRVAIESTSIEGKLQKSVDHTVLQPGQSDLEVDYTALTYSKPEQVSFRYKLEGVDRTWQEVGHRRTAYYSRLPPGEYVFRVSARNSDSFVSGQDGLLRVSVIPPFYQRLWFVALVLLAVLVMVWSGWRYRLSQWKRAQAAQQAFSRELIASQENDRRRISAELHDSLGQRLIIINNLALYLLRTKGKVRTEEEKQETIEQINEEASHAIEETRAISYALRPFQLDRLGLARAIQALVKTVTRATGIEFVTTIGDIDGVFPDELRINFYRIVQEALNNIVKHAEATRGTVTAERMSASIVLRISDNGRGISTEARSIRESPGGFGMTGMRERATVLHGILQVKSEPGDGTVLTVEFPIEGR